MPKFHTQFLSEIPFFSEVSQESLSHLGEHIEEERFFKNEVIFQKNTVGHSMYVVLEGEVKVHDKNHIYDKLSKGDCFGEYALIDDNTRSATITAIKSTKVLKIQRDHFLNLLQHDSGFAQGILSVMIKRHRELDTFQAHLASSKVEIENAHNKLSGLVNGAMDAIIMFGNDFRVILCNPAAKKLIENDDVLQRNVLFFFEEESAKLIENIIISKDATTSVNRFLPDIVKVIGSNGTETLNEGTISKYGSGNQTFYTLILRNISERLIAQDKIDSLTKQTAYLEEEIKELTSSYGIIAENPKMKKVLNLIQQVAGTDATVLIHGETGTGKELVARAIHRESGRNDKPLIRINCGAIPANLIESELFGHEKGAFTGATANRKGRFLLADKGTIFLDEIGEMPLELQPKLLRIIQEGEFDPVGSSETIKVDVRIIAATHRDLFELSKAGKFREDLFYRLNVFPIEIPALRERGHDICLIAEEIINLFSKKLNKPVVELSEHDKTLLSSYNWPGNVRELQNLIERAVIVSKHGHIDWNALIPNNFNAIDAQDKPQPDQILTSKELSNLEKENILRALKLSKWKISGANGAASLLQMRPTTLSSRIKALNIERPI